MKVEMSKSFQVNAPIGKVWAFLSDIEQVTPCVPGAELGEALDENRHSVIISVKVGPIKSSYKGEVKVANLDAVNHQMRIQGKGTDVKGKGGATMEMTGTLTSIDDNITEVKGDSTVTITGMLAQFGSRMVEDVSNMMFDQFTANVKSRLEGDGEQEAVAAKPVAGMSIAAKALKGAVSRTVDRAKEKIGLSVTDPDDSG